MPDFTVRNPARSRFNCRFLHLLAALQCLSPIAIATVATWMARAGLSEAEILRVIV